MQNNYEEELELNLMDLLYAGLKKWRSMLIGMVVFAVLMGGYSYIHSMKTIKAAQSAASATETKAVTLTADEMKNVERIYPQILTYQDMQNKMQEYYDQSIYMHIDSNHVSKVTLVYVLKNKIARSSNTLDAITENYLNLAISDEMLEAAANRLNEKQDELGLSVPVQASYLNELLSWRSSYQTLEGTEGVAGATGTTGNTVVSVDASQTENTIDKVNTIVMSVIGPNEEFCQIVADCMDEAMEGLTDQISSEIAPHRFSLLNREYADMINTGIYDAQTSRMRSLMDYENKINDLKNSLTETEQAYVEEKLLASTEEKAASAEQETEILSSEAAETASDNLDLSKDLGSPAVSRKYVILGALLGLILVFGIEIVRFMLSARLHNRDDLKKMYGIVPLGQIAVAGQAQLKGLDAWLYKICHLHERKLSRTEAMEIIKTSIVIAAQKNEWKQILFTGCNMGATAGEVTEELLKKLSGTGLVCTSGDCMAYHPGTMEQLTKADAVVLVETLETSLYTEIAKEKDLCDAQQVPVLGAVTIA